MGFSLPQKFLNQNVKIEWGSPETLGMVGKITEATDIYVVVKPEFESHALHLIPWTAIHSIELMKEKEATK